VRLTLLGAAIVLAAGGPLPPVLGRVLPGLSPLVAVTSAIAQRHWFLGLFWAGPPLAVLALAVWKGRWFCRWICPAGTIYAIPARWSLKKTFLKFPVNAFLFWLIVGSALTAAPLLAVLDPLSTLNRLSPLLTGTYTAASLVPGLIVPAVLALGAVQPLIWCARICPMGYFLELCQSIRRDGPARPMRQSRRQILAGLAVGVPAGMLARKFLFAAGADPKRLPILPPGADDVESFAAACTRCYACVDACPTRAIRVNFDLSRPAGQLFLPEMGYYGSEDRPDCGFCAEACNLCNQVCPAGALTPLAFEHKWRRQIAVATIHKPACLAWTDGQDCSVCQEVCSYGAVDLNRDAKGVAKPTIRPDACRGCGVCYSRCPAIRAGKAISFAAVAKQKRLADPTATAPTSAPATGKAE
jgi:NAD-dependent dihydropyrimidine dehydrogenase PreA subunit